jgi:predicted HTH transcriptional regulator
MATEGIEAIEITGGERDRLLSLEEGHFADLKAIEVSTKKLGSAVSAFANATGGDLYVGIGETDLLGVKIRTWRGSFGATPNQLPLSPARVWHMATAKQSTGGLE